MTGNATGSWKCAARLMTLPLLCLGTQAAAQDDVTSQTVTARDVAMTPLADLNLSRDPIPDVLLEVSAEPYADRYLDNCNSLLQQIGNLDAVLGEDYDTQEAEGRQMTVGSVAQSAVRMLIPFRGLIREVSGANNQAHEFREAIMAGVARRAYLKGMGQAMNCPYPARPARAGDFPQPLPEQASGTAAAGTAPLPYVQQPVVQSLD